MYPRWYFGLMWEYDSVLGSGTVSRIWEYMMDDGGDLFVKKSCTVAVFEVLIFCGKGL